MIYEERIYTIKPGSTAVYLKNYEELALDILMECLSNLVGFWSTEHGHINQLVHIWAFEGLDDRLARRKKLAEHPVGQPILRPTCRFSSTTRAGSCCPRRSLRCSSEDSGLQNRH